LTRTWVAGGEEAPAVARLLISFRDHLGRGEPADDAFERGVAHFVADDHTELLLASSGETPEGVAVLRFRHGIWRDGLDCLVEDVYVQPDARGRGLGRALVSFAIERARARGARRLELDVAEDNAAALALYGSFGFVDRYSADAPRDLYMRLHIDP
jgi:ribosomal protein S18 acetylase RimI-like enzyme